MPSSRRHLDQPGNSPDCPRSPEGRVARSGYYQCSECGASVHWPQGLAFDECPVCESICPVWKWAGEKVEETEDGR